MTERWHLNGFNLCEVIVIRDGPDDKGRSYVDGRHQVSVKIHETIEAAAEAVREHNASLNWPQEAIDQIMIDPTEDPLKEDVE